MIYLLVRIAETACKKNELLMTSKKNVHLKIYYNLLKYIISFFIEFILKVQYIYLKKTITPLKYDLHKPIVSLTTFPARINSLWVVIFSIFNQKYTPSKVVLILAVDEFPKMEKSLPNNLKIFLNKGLEIKFVSQNLKPHNKYFYTFSEYKNKSIITLDDDLYYWPDTIFKLIELSKKYPEHICANSVVSINFKDDKLFFLDNVKPYCVDRLNFARGVCGVLYPANFRPDELFNTDKIKELSPNADDLWLKIHSLLQNINIVCGSKYTTPLFVLGSQKYALRYSNVDKNENYNQLKKILNEYKEIKL